MKTLTFEYVSSLFPKASRRKYGKGQIIYYQGDNPHYAYYVIGGHIRYYDIDKNGNEKILHIDGPKNVFPMLFAYGITQEIDGFYATLDNAELLAIPLEDFRKKLQTDIEFANSLTKWFLTEIDQLVYRINSFERNDAKSKVLHALRHLAHNYGEQAGEWHEINFPVTQQFVADFTGLTRETVSAAMNELEKHGSISSKKRTNVSIKASELKSS